MSEMGNQPEVDASVSLLLLGDVGCGKSTFLAREIKSNESSYGHGERLPVMMLGLKRDLRREGPEIIYPQEAYRIAQELRCDRYAECSAVTGELLPETFEDLARLAAMTTTEKGGQTPVE
ncbi:hypothetical protein PENANT_c002G03563 [Penicillium antarcticum]|uniref:Uncharacterized protein n=1 Tax=Penicillium antarcticum TaxID=416450 RepID=A0A1V6QJJ9_9EURO|nr:hypothetical protein PENANT_c002G03563 [Penicillium antarcticum]